MMEPCGFRTHFRAWRFLKVLQVTDLRPLLSEGALNHSRVTGRGWKWVPPWPHRGGSVASFEPWSCDAEEVNKRCMSQLHQAPGGPLEEVSKVVRPTDCLLFMSKVGGHAGSCHPCQTAEAEWQSERTYRFTQVSLISAHKQPTNRSLQELHGNICSFLYFSPVNFLDHTQHKGLAVAVYGVLFCKLVGMVLSHHPLPFTKEVANKGKMTRFFILFVFIDRLEWWNAHFKAIIHPKIKQLPHLFSLMWF